MRHLIMGIIFVVLGAWGIIAWWGDFGVFLRGLIPILLVLGGLAGIGAGVQKTKHQAGHEDEGSDESDPDALVYRERDRLAG